MSLVSVFSRKPFESTKQNFKIVIRVTLLRLDSELVNQIRLALADFDVSDSKGALTLFLSKVALVFLLVVGQEVFLEAALVEVRLLAAIEEKVKSAGL